MQAKWPQTQKIRPLDRLLRSAMIFFYLANEGLSILENLAIFGVPIPQRLKQVIADLGEENPPKKSSQT